MTDRSSRNNRVSTPKKKARPRRLAEKLADKYSPRIYWNNGDLESEYHYIQTIKAVNEALAEAALVAENPYSDAVCTIGQESPLRVGAKISKAIKSLLKRRK